MAGFIERFSFDEEDGSKMLIDMKGVLHDMEFMTTERGILEAIKELQR